MSDAIVIGAGQNKIVYDSASMKTFQLYQEANSWAAYLSCESSETGSAYTVPVGKKCIIYNIECAHMSSSGAAELGINTSTASIGTRIAQFRATTTPYSTSYPCWIEVPRGSGNQVIASIYNGHFNLSCIEVDA